MIPKSFSATALQTFELCPARYHAENIERSKGVGGVAASVGSTTHGALEMFVQACYIERTHQPTFDLLIDFLRMSYVATFNSNDYTTEQYVDAYDMLDRWFKRTVKENYFEDITRVVSVEVKTNFPVPTSIGDIPFNYIWDRFDEIKPGVFKVVDYKTNRWGITSADLQKKIQARAYGLAAAIQLKQQGIAYERIWVEFDMLRHAPVGRVFTREDNAAFWKFLKESAKRIIDTPDDEVEEKLNDQCLFCVRKAQCGALQKNIMVGGIHSVGNIEAAIDLRAQLEWQKKGLESLIKEMDGKILTEARERDIEEYESDLNKLKITVSSQRAIDAEMAEKAIGPSLFEKYGKKGLAIGDVEKLLKGTELTSQQKSDLRSLIYQKKGEPKVKIIPKNPIDDE